MTVLGVIFVGLWIKTGDEEKFFEFFFEKFYFLQSYFLADNDRPFSF